jgi:hypothetical protein
MNARWKLHISIHPDSVLDAFKIIYQIINSSDIKIQGKLHTADMTNTNKCQPGKQFAFIVLVVDEDIDKLRNLLQHLANELYSNSIKTDPRPINSDPEQASRKWDLPVKTDGIIPAYFNYRTDIYTIIDDNDLADYTMGYPPYKENTKIFVDNQDSPNIAMIERTYWNSLSSDEKGNPLKYNDPFKSILIEKQN